MEGVERARKPRKPDSDRFGRLTFKETIERKDINDAVLFSGNMWGVRMRLLSFMHRNEILYPVSLSSIIVPCRVSWIGSMLWYGVRVDDDRELSEKMVMDSYSYSAPSDMSDVIPLMLQANKRTVFRACHA